MENIPTISTVHKYFKDTELLKEVVGQIQKDFEWYNIKIEFKGIDKTPYEELFEQIFPHIDRMIVEEYEKLQNIMYKIDLEEEKVNRYLRENPMADTSELITDLILKRELQKVVIRKMFSRQPI